MVDKVFLRIIFHFEIRIRSRSRGSYPFGPKHGKRLWVTTYRWSAYTGGVMSLIRKDFDLHGMWVILQGQAYDRGSGNVTLEMESLLYGS